MPPSPSDWLPDNLAWFVIDAIEQTHIDATLDGRRTEGKGDQAYPPRVMLAQLICGHCTATIALRKIEVQIEEGAGHAEAVSSPDLSPEESSDRRIAA